MDILSLQIGSRQRRVDLSQKSLYLLLSHTAMFRIIIAISRLKGAHEGLIPPWGNKQVPMSFINHCVLIPVPRVAWHSDSDPTRQGPRD